MTCREKLAIEHPKEVRPNSPGGCFGCPSHYGYLADPDSCCDGMSETCTECWDREIPEENNTANDTPHILDSGHRREFETGAVRDICEGKGRCDLLPLDVVAEHYRVYDNNQALVFSYISRFIRDGNIQYLYASLRTFTGDHDWNTGTMLLEVSKHFEEGCKKYGDNNWQKGIPVRCYIDSAVRHYLKYLRGDKDEPHDRAFCWNILCCIWTCKHKPELNDYAVKKEDS